MKFIWKLNASWHGFALLDVPNPLTLVVLDFLNPFTRFYLEGYFQTVAATKLSLAIYKRLVKDITDNYNYEGLSKFFEISANLGGVRLTFCLRADVGVCVCVCLFGQNIYNSGYKQNLKQAIYIACDIAYVLGLRILHS